MTASPLSIPSTPEEFTSAIRAFLQWRVEVEKRNCGIVVGIMDEQGSSIVSCGKLSKDSTSEVDGDTIFEIGSITKTFAGLLLQDLIDRGEVKTDDPAAKYLPATVRMPARRGKQITLLHLATHTSGLPRMPDNANPKRADNLPADYTVEKLYDFLSRFKLTRSPGAQFEYSNVGLGLLSHIITLKTSKDFESLVIERICRPLRMDSTCITLTPELRRRFAQGHNQLGYPTPGLDFGPAMVGAGAMRSTANDLLKYVSVNLGLVPSSLTPLMQRSHELRFRPLIPRVAVGLTWMTRRDPQGRQFIMHGGGTDGYSTWCGFDKTRRRGAVVLSNSSDFDIGTIGLLLLESEWHSERRPKAIQSGRSMDSSIVGRYRLCPDAALGLLAARTAFYHISKMLIAVPAALCLAVLAILVWRSSHPWIILGVCALSCGFLANAFALGLSRFICRLLHPVIGIRREGDRLFIQAIQSPRVRSSLLLPLHDAAVNQAGFTLPQITGELLPDSENVYCERLSGVPLIFSGDAAGRVTRLSMYVFGGKCSFEKISDEPPPTPGPAATRLAIKLDEKLLDACAGQYDFTPSTIFPTGIKLSVWCQNGQLLGQAWGKNVLEGAFDLYAESETDFFLTVVGAQLTFTRNPAGEVTAAVLHRPGQPDMQGTKASASAT